MIMRALRVKNGELGMKDVPKPECNENEALIRVETAGICATDIEIVKGYMNFQGTLGHEFVGIVEECDAMPGLIGQRVVGEINSACGHCDACRNDLPRHCPNRDVLGISGRDGAFAEYLVLPAWNVHVVPDEINNNSAVLIEPLAAACEILEQFHLSPSTPVLLIGDGKLAHLIARAMTRSFCLVEVVGRSESKVRRMKGHISKGYLNASPPGQKYPVIIEASGSPSGWRTAMKAIQPQGTIILKSTYSSTLKFNPAPLVVNEITVIGSRCGPFKPAITALNTGLKVDDIIDEEFDISNWEAAFKKAQEPDTLKVLFRFQKS